MACDGSPKYRLRVALAKRHVFSRPWTRQDTTWHDAAKMSPNGVITQCRCAALVWTSCRNRGTKQLPHECEPALLENGRTILDLEIHQLVRGIRAPAVARGANSQRDDAPRRRSRNKVKDLIQILPQPFLQFCQDNRRNNPSNPATINRENLGARQLDTILGAIFFNGILAN